MANRSDRGREQPAALSRASKPAKQNGSSSAETIRASGHDRANRPYTRLHPDKARQTFTDPLATREPSTQDSAAAYGLFKTAVALEPSLAEAHLGLARALIAQWDYGSVDDFAPSV